MNHTYGDCNDVFVYGWAGDKPEWYHCSNGGRMRARASFWLMCLIAICSVGMSEAPLSARPAVSPQAENVDHNTVDKTSCRYQAGTTTILEEDGNETNYSSEEFSDDAKVDGCYVVYYDYTYCYKNTIYRLACYAGSWYCDGCFFAAVGCGC